MGNDFPHSLSDILYKEQEEEPKTKSKDPNE